MRFETFCWLMTTIILGLILLLSNRQDKELEELKQSLKQITKELSDNTRKDKKTCVGKEKIVTL